MKSLGPCGVPATPSMKSTPSKSRYQALFSPSVQAGILKASDLPGYRNDQVSIRGALHVPLSIEAVRDCMPLLFELLEAETEPRARAVLGHFLFVYIHSYMDGNGRLARFLTNLMLVPAGYEPLRAAGQRASEQSSDLHKAPTLSRPLHQLYGRVDSTGAHD